MATKSRVAVLKVTPETILDDIERLLDLADVRKALDPSSATILKDNISWHFPFPGANTTPWQLEGTTLALRKAGYRDLVCVQNKTVVTNAFKGEDLNHYVPVFKRHDIPVLYNFKDEDMKWIEYTPESKMLVLDKVFPEGIRIPDYFLGKNIVHLPTVKCVSGETQLALADGSVVAIQDVVGEQHARAETLGVGPDGEVHVAGRVELLAMDASGAIRPHTATWFWRSKLDGRRVLRLRTRAGRTLVATADHRIFTPEGWCPLGGLRIDDRVAAADRLGAPGAGQPATRVAATANRATEGSPARPDPGGQVPGSLETAVAAVEEVHRPACAVEVVWDVVREIDEVPGCGIDLFDITVPGAESFVGNGLILHNCHIYTTTTGAMKNAFGGLLNTRRHYTHSWIHATLVDLLAIQKEIHTGVFAVMDGTTAGNGPGPRTMIPVVKDYMLASADQVAIDAVSARMMGFDPMSIEYIHRGHEAGLGIGRPDEIEVVGTDIGGESWGFEVGDNSASRVGDLLWFGRLKSIQNLLFRTPLVNLFIFGSEAYHDFYRWPAKDRRTYQRWLRQTPWGRLFALYADGKTPRAASVDGVTGD